MSRQKFFQSLRVRFRILIEKFLNYILFIFVLFLFFSLIRGVFKLSDSDKKIKEAEHRLRELEEEKKDLESKLSMIESEDYLEKQVRDKLGLVREGEIVVILPDAEIVKKFAPKIEENQEVLSEANWKKWLKLFGF